MKDPYFANQSVTLYTTYYLIHILIYRPFLPGSLRSLSNAPPHTNMPVPCVAVCVNAGKSCAKILRSQIQQGISNIPTLICGSHMCAAILLMNFWDLKWQERRQLQSGGVEDVKPMLAPAMAELLDDVSFFVKVLKHVRPRWRNAEMYLYVIRSVTRLLLRVVLYRKDLSTSMPYGLDNTGGDSHKENTSLGMPPPDYHANPPDYRPAPPSEYHAASLPPITTYAYGSMAEPINGSPQWFDFPHLTRHPVPAALPVWAQNGGHTWCPHLQTGTSSLRSSHNYDDPAVHLSLEARKASISSLDSGVIMPPNSMRGPDMRVPDRRVPRSDRSIICPQFESVPLNTYAQHSGSSHVRTDAAHYQYASTSEPRSVCLFAKSISSDVIFRRHRWTEWEQAYGPRSANVGNLPRPSHAPRSEYSQGHTISYSGHY